MVLLNFSPWESARGLVETQAAGPTLQASDRPSGGAGKHGFPPSPLRSLVLSPGTTLGEPRQPAGSSPRPSAFHPRSHTSQPDSAAASETPACCPHLPLMPSRPSHSSPWPSPYFLPCSLVPSPLPPPTAGKKRSPSLTSWSKPHLYPLPSAAEPSTGTVNCCLLC